MATEPWHYGRSETAILQSLHRSLGSSFPTAKACWPFAPYVGDRFKEGPRLLFYGKATGGWGDGKRVPARLTPGVLNKMAQDCVVDPPHSRFWTFLDETTAAVLRALDFPEGSDWPDRHPFIAWSNYLKQGEHSVRAPGLKVYLAQRREAEALIESELERWKPRIVITVTNLDYGLTTAEFFGADAKWRKIRAADLWARDAGMPGNRKARVFWSCHPGPLPTARRQAIVDAIEADLKLHPPPA